MSKNEQPNSGFSTPSLPVTLNRQQLDVYMLLREYATDHHQLHEWYRAAIETINSASPDKVSQAAHSIRELCDKLPSRLGVPVYQTPLPLLNAIRDDFRVLKKGIYSDGWHGKVVSPALGDMLAQLEHLFQLSDEPPRQDRLKIALTSSDIHTALMSKQQLGARDEAFRRIGTFFQNATHHTQPVSEATFRDVLETFESLLLNYLRPCTAAQHSELLALIRQGPTPENQRKCKGLISFKAANFLFFFEKLDNPQWLDFLDNEGFFSDLPGPQRASDDSIQYVIHIPLLAFPRLAQIAPEPVARILAKVVLPDNQRVGDQVLQCMANIRDRNCIRQLTPVIRQLKKNLSRTSWLWIEELLGSWFKVEAYEEAFEIAQLFLFAAVDASAKSSGGPDSWLARQVGEKVLDPLAAKFPLENAVLLFKALRRWVGHTRSRYNPSDLSEDDPSSYWLDDFKNPSSSYPELESLLATRLYSAAANIFGGSEAAKIQEIDELLRSNPWQLFRRLRWQLYADFPNVSLQYARSEVLERVTLMRQLEHVHDYELAQFLECHSRTHGLGFLSRDEVDKIFDTIMSGPVDKAGKEVEGLDKNMFRRKQLEPMLPLLSTKQRLAFQELVPVEKSIELKAYKPFNPGVTSYEVVSVAPPRADFLEQMQEEELWEFLNTWQPKVEFPKEGKWVREDLSALAAKFADLVARLPDRFNPATQWWKQIKRPVILYGVLERATDHFIRKQHDENKTIPAPTKVEWGNWFGIIGWIVEQKRSATAIACDSQATKLDWNWGWSSITRLLRMVLKSDHTIPEPHLAESQAVLKYLIEQDDSKWDDDRHPAMSDWLTTAINSDRGNTIEALMNLAFRQKKECNRIEPWVFDLVKCCLCRSNESPGTFALFGAHLRFAVYLFGDEFKKATELVLPSDRPTHRKAAIISHFRYDHPQKAVLDAFPALPSLALDILESEADAERNANQGQEWRDFGSRLGTHIALYHWTEAFASERAGEKLLDRFFATANEGARKGLINHIGQIFEPPNHTYEEIIVRRVMAIWERRIQQIQQHFKTSPHSRATFEGELAEFTDWLDCECFPLEWRVRRAEEAIGLLSRAPHAYRLLKTVVRFGEAPERLNAGLKLFHAILGKPSDELRWSIQFKNLSPIVKAGLNGNDDSTKKYAIECLDRLLKLGCSDFMQLKMDQDDAGP